MGNEDPLATQPWLTPVQITPVMGVDCTIDDDFDSFQLIANAAGAICGFKFWSVANSQAVFEAQSQTWHGDTGGVGVNPFWVSPLRVPGDISNTQVPYSGYGEVWNHGHAYSAPLGDPGTLNAETDPAYMANTSACQAWLYPRITPHCFIDPGLTPLVPTFYKAPQFFEFADLGSIATEDHQIISIQYVGFSFPSTAEAAAFNESWGLFKDEGGVEVSDRIDPQYRFFPGTSLGNSVVNIPPGTTGIPKASTVYLWKFGAQFLWNPVTPQRDASQANLAYMFLYVTYLGYPTGNPGLSAEDMAGLFVIDRGGPSVDRYNRNVITRIPQPTIRTAYIGE
jgi:hypothetical protein